jgi:DNA-binding IclR family transcriptional regulator
VGGNFSKHVMELLSSRQDSMSVIEIARKLRVNRSYASGYLDAMVDAGMLEKRKVGPAKLYKFSRERLR